MSRLWRRPRNVAEVAARQLCTGCGACAYVSPDEVQLVDVKDFGIRPVLHGIGTGDGGSGDAMRVCPGVNLEHDERELPEKTIPELRSDWGPVTELWEGFASDDEIRLAASSGGAATALALYGLERAGMYGVLHIAARPDAPHLNHTVLSDSREALLAATGSRYSPASPCDGLDRIENAPGPCVFIGKPCDVAATRKAGRMRPRLEQRIGLTVAIFCAGTPSTRGTLEMLRKMGIEDPSTLSELRFRGRGWPGLAMARVKTPDGEELRELSYERSWGLLQSYRPWRCKLCADHSGEFADVAVGDPWYRPISSDDPGRSLILARSERGRDFVRSAIQAGYLSAEHVAPRIVSASQPSLLRARGALWGRMLGCRIVGAPVPRYRGLPTFPAFCSALGWPERFRSIFGAIRRVFQKRLLRDLPRGGVRVLAISSGGGHWVQLRRLAPSFQGYETVWVTVDASCREQVSRDRFHVVNDATRWNKLGLLRLALRVLWLVAAERPGLVISTGAAPGLFGVLFGKLLGARTIWVDSIANAEELSLSGRLAGRFADLWLTQWPHLEHPTGPSYAGDVL